MRGTFAKTKSFIVCRYRSTIAHERAWTVDAVPRYPDRYVMSGSDLERQVDGFLAKYEPAIEADLRAARKRLCAKFSHGFELIFDNYNALVFGISPTQKASDAFISIAGYPRWVTLFLLNGATLDDPNRLLEGDGKQVRSVRLKSPADIDRPHVQALIDQVIRRHAAALAAAPPLTSVVKMVVAKQRPRRPAPTKTARAATAKKRA
jgi:hypothetical protein